MAIHWNAGKILWNAAIAFAEACCCASPCSCPCDWAPGWDGTPEFWPCDTLDQLYTIQFDLEMWQYNDGNPNCDGPATHYAKKIGLTIQIGARVEASCSWNGGSAVVHGVKDGGIDAIWPYSKMTGDGTDPLLGLNSCCWEITFGTTGFTCDFLKCVGNNPVGSYGGCTTICFQFTQWGAPSDVGQNEWKLVITNLVVL